MVGNMNTSEKIYDLICKLKETSGSNAKKALVVEFIKDPDLKKSLREFITHVHSTENMYQSKIDESLYTGGGFFEESIASDKCWKLAYQNFMSGVTRGSIGAENLAKAFYSCSTKADKEMLRLVVYGEIKCGIGAATWNKLFGYEVVYIPPYQRCSKLSQGNHLKWNSPQGMIVQTKEDAQFLNMILTRDDDCEKIYVNFRTRSFKKIENEFVSDLLTNALNSNNFKFPIVGDVFMGEIYVTQDGVRFGREKSNGLINSIIQTGELSEGNGFDIVLWDHVHISEFINKSSDEKYSSRLCAVEEFVDDYNKAVDENFPVKISVVKTAYVKSMEEVGKIFHSIVNDNGEGVVIKNPDGVWEHNDDGHKDLVKVKIPMNVKLRIKGFNEADETSRHRNTFASLIMESEDGKIATSMSGMSDKQREEINANREAWLGKIIELKCNGIQYNPEEPHSLYYPSFECERPDVLAAQTLEDIKLVQQSAIEAIAMI